MTRRQDAARACSASTRRVRARRLRGDRRGRACRRCSSRPRTAASGPASSPPRRSRTRRPPAATRTRPSATGRTTRSSRPRRAQAGFPDIARQLVELPHGDGIEVVLGGGRAFFLPADRGRSRGPEHRRARAPTAATSSPSGRQRNPAAPTCGTREQLAALDRRRRRRVLGLFEPEHMKFEADRAQDRGGEPSLARDDRRRRSTCSSASPKGYFLMVEGGRIDHGHHAGNAYRALDETIELLRRGARRARAHEPRRHADRRHRRPQPHADDLGLPEARQPDPRPGRRLDGRGQRRAPTPGAGPDRAVPTRRSSYANGPGYPGASRTRSPRARSASRTAPKYARTASRRAGPTSPASTRRRRTTSQEATVAARLRDPRRRGRADLRRRPRRRALPRRAGAELRLPRDGGGAGDRGAVGSRHERAQRRDRDRRRGRRHRERAATSPSAARAWCWSSAASSRSGASYGNAGWISPSHGTPLPAPGVIRQALRWLLDPESPFYVKPRRRSRARALAARLRARGHGRARARDDAAEPRAHAREPGADREARRDGRRGLRLRAARAGVVCESPARARLRGARARGAARARRRRQHAHAATRCASSSRA